MTEATISVVRSPSLLMLYGVGDQHLRRIREKLQVDIRTVPDGLSIRGDEQAVSRATAVIEQMQRWIARHGTLGLEQVSQLLSSADPNHSLPDAPPLDVYNTKRKIRPKTAGQVRLVQAIRDHELIFCVGPAGTGKTYLAVAMAVAALKQSQVRKIVLVRPAVEAGESLGFLPGDLQAKINPYLRPLLDALGEMMDFDQIKRLTEQDLIEMIPLAYMRGRTLNEAFIILDEAQNTTVAQMKMFLTRMGMGSKIVICGDVTQVDLPAHKSSGLMDAITRLKDIPGLTQVRLAESDVVRHRLVQDIVRAYDEPTPKRRTQ